LIVQAHIEVCGTGQDARDAGLRGPFKDGSSVLRKLRVL